MEQLRQAYARGVLLIGDAAHAQPILGGEGANQAIVDAMSLAEYIAAHGVGGLEKWYETALLRCGRLVVSGRDGRYLRCMRVGQRGMFARRYERRDTRTAKLRLL